MITTQKNSAEKINHGGGRHRPAGGAVKTMLVTMTATFMAVSILFLILQKACSGPPPVIKAQTFTVNENSPAGTLLGTVVATGPDGDTLSAEITGGTGSTVFDIDKRTREIKVIDPSKLDFETAAGFTLDVEVTDQKGRTDTAAITINVIKEGGGPPPPPPPPPGPLHPLVGEQRIFLASRGVKWVNSPLTWAPELAGYTTIQDGEAPIWRFEAVQNEKDHYQIYLRSSHPRWDGAELTFDKPSGKVCVDNKGGSKWMIEPVEGSGNAGRYLIRCALGKDAGGFHGRELRLAEPEEHGWDWPSPIATLGEGGQDAEWHILPRGKYPKPLDLHYVIVFPRSDLEGEAKEKVIGWAKEMQRDVDAGADKFCLTISKLEGSGDPLECRGREAPSNLYTRLRMHVRERGDSVDRILPVSAKPPSLPGVPVASVEQAGPFPIVFEIPDHGNFGAFEITEMQTIRFWDNGYEKGRTLEELEDLQMKVDLRFKDKRVFYGHLFHQGLRI